MRCVLLLLPAMVVVGAQSRNYSSELPPIPGTRTKILPIQFDANLPDGAQERHKKVIQAINEMIVVTDYIENVAGAGRGAATVEHPHTWLTGNAACSCVPTLQCNDVTPCGNTDCNCGVIKLSDGVAEAGGTHLALPYAHISFTPSAEPICPTAPSDIPISACVAALPNAVAANELLAFSPPADTFPALDAFYSTLHNELYITGASTLEEYQRAMQYIFYVVKNAKGVQEIRTATTSLYMGNGCAVDSLSTKILPIRASSEAAAPLYSIVANAIPVLMGLCVLWIRLH